MENEGSLPCSQQPGLGPSSERNVVVLDFKLSPCFESCMYFLGISPASDCGLPTFRNPLSVPSSRAGCKV